MVEYTIVIPAFNEGAVLGRVLEEIGKPALCKKVIVVEDGSTDDTAEVAKMHGATVLSHPENMGYGAALKTGIMATQTEIVVCCDGDGQHHLPDVLRIAEQADKYDMVVGVRDKASSKDWLRMPGKLILGYFASILTNKKIPDLNSGLRSFRVDSIKKFLHLMPNGFSFSTTSSIAMLRMGCSVHYVPISVKRRIGRKSTVNMLRDGVRVLMLILNLTALFNPMRVFTPLAFFFMFGGVFYFILYSIQERVHVTASMVLLFITGVLIFFLGLVCEQVSAIRREMHR